MKVLRAIFSVIVAAALVIGGVYVYRSCSDGCASFSCAGSLMTANAAEKDNSVLIDLQKDPNFKISDYLYIENDTSLQVIHIAENAKGGLYVYVYHPGGFEDKKVLALHVNMCTTYIENKPSSYNFYALTPDKGEKTIYRYTVDGFTAKSDPVRHYDIASITRSFIAGVDEEPGGDNTITEKAYPVGQAWTVAGIGELVQYSMVTRDVVDIASKYVASIRYYSPDVHNHIIAFTADRTLDELYEAEIIYTKQDVKTNNVSGIVITAGAQIDVTDVIVADHKETVVTPSGNKTVYSWDKIQSASAFCTAEKEVLDATVPRYSFNKDIRENVLKHDWVIRFLTTSYSVYSDGQARPTYYTDQTRVFDTCILRLKFEKDGVVYDLGVVDDVQSGKQPTVNTGGSRGGCDGGLLSDLWALLKRIGRFIRKFWQVVLPIGLAVVIGMVVIGVIEWGFKQK